jgi:hypothetical protein
MLFKTVPNPKHRQTAGQTRAWYGNIHQQQPQHTQRIAYSSSNHSTDTKKRHIEVPMLAKLHGIMNSECVGAVSAALRALCGVRTVKLLSIKLLHAADVSKHCCTLHTCAPYMGYKVLALPYLHDLTAVTN